MNPPPKVLIIQTAFLGDVVLATPLIENLYEAGCKIDFLLRAGNQSLLEHHPKINRLLIWNKGKNKFQNMFGLIVELSNQRYDYVFCLQRFMSAGLFAIGTGAKKIYGFDKNPLSLFFSKRVKHILDGRHEVERNLALLPPEFDTAHKKPRLYPQESDYQRVEQYQSKAYLTLSPASVWFTKQVSAHKWSQFLDRLDFEGNIYLLGGKSDKGFAQKIAEQTKQKVEIFCGELSLLQSAALMQKARMNFVNDSAPMHLASAVNAPVCAVFCSTVSTFGFGPLSDVSFTVEVKEKLECRPCGLHGKKACPKGHFDCCNKIDVQLLIDAVPKH